MNRVRTKEIDLNGRKLKLETGKLAMQADSSVVASWGETVVLATVASKPLAEDKGYFPLSVEFVEKHYTIDPEWRRITGEKRIKAADAIGEKLPSQVFDCLQSLH